MFEQYSTEQKMQMARKFEVFKLFDVYMKMCYPDIVVNSPMYLDIRVAFYTGVAEALQIVILISQMLPQDEAASKLADIQRQTDHYRQETTKREAFIR